MEATGLSVDPWRPAWFYFRNIMNPLRHNEERIRLRLWLLLVLLGAPGFSVQAAGPEPAGWYAGDMHVHRSCGSSPEAVSDIYSQMAGQNLAVVSLLADMGNGEVQNPVTDLPLVNGHDDPVSTPGQIVHWDAEWHWDATYTQYPHQALGGHLVLLGLTNAYQIWAEYTYPIFQFAHQQGAIAGFAHLQYLDDGFPQYLSCCTPIEYPVEVALGSCDFVSEDVAGGDSAIHAYYRLLNCGFRPGFAGGSDHPCSAAVGQTLTYVQIPGGQLTYSNWIRGIAQGRTVVSRNGHNEFLDLKVNGTNGPGDEIQLTNAGSVQVTVQWTAQASYSGTIELVKNGVVVSSLPASAGPGAPATLSTTVGFTNSGWLCARRMGNGEHAVNASAVFVTVNHAPVRASVDDAQFYVQWMDNLLALTSPGGAWSSYFVTNRAEAQARYSAARTVYQQVASQAAALLPVTIDTTALSYGSVNVAYSGTLAASGGATPYTWSIISGSLPPGLTLNTSSGTVTGTPNSPGIFNFTAQVRDNNNPAQTAIKPISITVTAVPLATLWPSSAVPGTVDGGLDNPVELGVKFRSDVAGFITAIRFYKASANTGAHIGDLWTAAGTLLATAAFTGETGSGWQQVNFASPVPISANTIYVASYHCNNGHYSADDNYFSSGGVDNPPLHALANGVSGPNGVYAYGASSVFPTNGFNADNYWVDVVLVTNTAPLLPAQNNRTINELTTLTVTNTATGNGTLSYTLVVTNLGNNSVVTNAGISSNGIITWTPTEAQGPGTNIFTTVVSGGSLSATNSFLVTVNEVNTAPVLPNQINRTIDVLTTLIVTNTATDSDIPANTLTYALVTAPTSASIDTNGVITWTPVPAQGSTTNLFTTRVTDNGTPNLSATNSYLVFVNPAPIIPPPVIESVRLSNGVATVTWCCASNCNYRLQYIEDLSATNWVNVAPDVRAAGPTATATDTIGFSPRRFYRVLLVP